MADAKSKFPSIKEIAAMGGKLFKDISTSVKEIICDYKKHHAQEATTCSAQSKHNHGTCAEKKSKDKTDSHN